MPQFHPHLSAIFFLLLLLPLPPSLAVTFTLTNNCRYTVWPGILSGAGTAPLATTGFALQSGDSRSLHVPSAWSGRLWGRTLCSTDPAGKFSCATGDCGKSTLECSGSGAAPPATLAEFTLDGSGGLDFYDVSLVDGYNLPMVVVPLNGSGGNCSTTGCEVDLNGSCPSDLKVMRAGGEGEGIACRSACEAFGSPEYCCSGAYGNPNTCKPSTYSRAFKSACPTAYSYAYDDGTSTFTCAGADYTIIFCPSVTSKKAKAETAELPLINENMIFLASNRISSIASRSAPISLVKLGFSWHSVMLLMTLF